uniref:Uncharacterized protein n=1 Tax=Megaselia scalaris TaxID=36166 RepID=T1GPP7_MEGSC
MKTKLSWRVHKGCEDDEGHACWCQILLVLALEFSDKVGNQRLSKSSPPKWVSLAVHLTSKIPSSMDKMETSKIFNCAKRNSTGKGVIDFNHFSLKRTYRSIS